MKKTNKLFACLLLPLLFTTSCGCSRPAASGPSGPAQCVTHNYNEFGVCENCGEFEGTVIEDKCGNQQTAIKLELITKTKELDEGQEATYLVSSPVMFNFEHESIYCLQGYFKLSEEALTGLYPTKANLLEVYEENDETIKNTFELLSGAEAIKGFNLSEFGYIRGTFRNDANYYAYFTYDGNRVSDVVQVATYLYHSAAYHTPDEHNVCTICGHDFAKKFENAKWSSNYFDETYNIRLTYAGNPSSNYKNQFSVLFSVDEEYLGKPAYVFANASQYYFDFRFYKLADGVYTDLTEETMMSDEQKGIDDSTASAGKTCFFYTGFAITPEANTKYLFVIQYKQTTTDFPFYGIFFNTHIVHNLNNNNNCDIDDCDYTTNRLMAFGTTENYNTSEYNNGNGRKLTAGYTWYYRSTTKGVLNQKYVIKIKYENNGGTYGFAVRNESRAALSYTQKYDSSTKVTSYTVTLNEEGYLYFDFKNTAKPMGSGPGDPDNQKYNYIYVKMIALLVAEE